MTKELRIMLDAFRIKLLIEKQQSLSHGEDKKVVDKIAMYLWKKSRADMVGSRDKVLDND